MRQIVRHRPDTGEQWNEVRVRVRECELDGLRWGRRLAPQDCGIEVEKGADEFPAIVLKTCGFDELGLKRHVGVAQQPRLTLQTADERRQIAVVDRAPDLLHDEHLPQSERCDLRKVRFLESLDERDAVGASVDVFAELGIERDRSFQQK